MSAARAFVRPRRGAGAFTGRTSWRATGVTRVLTAAAFAVVLTAIVVSHRPDSLIHPQLYAEDGQNWFAGAHNIGAASLLAPLGGYLLIFQRTIGLLFAPLGLSGAAYAFAAVSVAVQVAPAVMFASRRMRRVVRDDTARMVIALVYVVIPNIELTGNLTNTQWHLAVLALLVILAIPPRSRAGRAFDVTALLVAGLTGPYAFFLLPIAVLVHRRDLSRWRITEVAVLAGAALVQGVVLLIALHATPRSSVPLDVSAGNFVLIISNQLLTRFGLAALPATSLARAALITLGVGGILGAACWRGPVALRCLTAFALATAVAGILLPYDHSPHAPPAWPAMATGATGNRYFFFLAVALVVCVAWIVCRAASLRKIRGSVLSIAGLAALALLSLPAWSYTPLADEHLSHYQALLDSAPAGTMVTIPLDPPGWSMQVRAG